MKYMMFAKYPNKLPRTYFKVTLNHFERSRERSTDIAISIKEKPAFVKQHILVAPN